MQSVPITTDVASSNLRPHICILWTWSSDFAVTRNYSSMNQYMFFFTTDIMLLTKKYNFWTKVIIFFQIELRKSSCSIIRYKSRLVGYTDFANHDLKKLHTFFYTVVLQKTNLKKPRIMWQNPIRAHGQMNSSSANENTAGKNLDRGIRAIS
jgi:hypothetical protein